jgi:hypothetical protein
MSDLAAATTLMMEGYQIRLCDHRGSSDIPRSGWLTPVTKSSTSL